MSDFGMPLCAHTIQDMETCWTALISEAKVWHAICIKEIEDDYAHALAEAENCCSSAIWDAESRGASKTCSIQQCHAKDIQHLEAEAIEEEEGTALPSLLPAVLPSGSTLPRPMA